MDARSRFAAWEWVALFVAAAAFVIIRLPLYTHPGLLLGWNSDAGLFGMMARAMADGTDFPLYFWGQFYLGTLTSMLTSLFPRVDALALRLAVAIEVFSAIVFFWLGLRRTFGRLAAAMAMLWLVAGPYFLFHFTIAPIGAEQLFFIASIVFCYVTHVSFDRELHWLGLGVLLGFGLWLHPFVMLLFVGVGAALFRKVSWKRALLVAGGAAVGFVPAIIALTNAAPRLYRRTLEPWSVVLVFQNLRETLLSDLWLLIADSVIVGAVMVVLALFAARRGEWNPGRVIAATTIVVSLAFWVFSNYPYPGAVRYIVPVVPLLYGFAADGLTRLRPILTAAGAIAIALMLFVPRALDARDVAAGKAEQYVNWPGGFDPRPVLHAMRERGYTVCYGEVWVAHKLEWLSEPTVPFVPVRSVHRTLPRSLKWIHKPGPKCFVDNHGNVRTLTAAEEAHWKRETELRAVRAGLR